VTVEAVGFGSGSTPQSTIVVSSEVISVGVALTVVLAGFSCLYHRRIGKGSSRLAYNEDDETVGKGVVE